MARAPRNPSPVPVPEDSPPALPYAQALTQARRKSEADHRAASEAADRIVRALARVVHALQTGEKIAAADYDALKPFVKPAPTES